MILLGQISLNRDEYLPNLQLRKCYEINLYCRPPFPNWSMFSEKMIIEQAISMRMYLVCYVLFYCLVLTDTNMQTNTI